MGGGETVEEQHKPEAEGTGESGARIAAQGAAAGSPQGGTKMQVEMDAGAAASSAAVGSMGGDVTQLMEDLMRRVEQLERQVAAQTEELRVQRAAIARTQRAVRSMSRGSDEDAATEPAPRDPKKPTGPRVG